MNRSNTPPQRDRLSSGYCSFFLGTLGTNQKINHKPLSSLIIFVPKLTLGTRVFAWEHWEQIGPKRPYRRHKAHQSALFSQAAAHFPWCWCFQPTRRHLHRLIPSRNEFTTAPSGAHRWPYRAGPTQDGQPQSTKPKAMALGLLMGQRMYPQSSPHRWGHMPTRPAP